MDQHNLIMGIVNVTPDSFSDGGHFFLASNAIDKAHQLIAEGADLVDIGAESTRPGATPLSVEDEWTRLQPVLAPLIKEGLGPLLSVDTRKPLIMLRAAEMGVGTINDVEGGRDQITLRKLAKTGVTYIAMHMKESPQTMQEKPLSGSAALAEMSLFYEQTTERFQALGFQKSHVWLDPGIGFGKSDGANMQLIKQAIQLKGRFPIVLGVSRKSFIGRMLQIADPLERDKPTKMFEIGLMLHGIKAIRTHDVGALHLARELLN